MESGLITRRAYQHRLDGIFGTPRGRGERVMQACRDAGLVSVGKQGFLFDRPLLPLERAALILVAALCAGTNLTIVQAADLVSADGNWRRQVLAAAVTGAHLTLWPAVNPALTVAVTVPTRVIRDPVVGFAGPMALDLAA
jgi:hypothetical protein